MECASWHEQRDLPLSCSLGHPWDPRQLSISLAPCDCAASLVGPGLEHVVVRCHQLTCAETWRADKATLIRILEDRVGRPAAARDGAHAMGVLDAAWTLLMQASEHHMALLKPAHLSTACVARLRTWIEDCETAIDEAQRLGALIVRSGEAAHVEEIAARVAGLADAFYLYARMLERFRSVHEVPVPDPQPGPLAATAEDERVLLKPKLRRRVA